MTMTDTEQHILIPSQPRDSLGYYPEAKKAQHLEQAGEYTQASKAWKKANLASCNKVNQDWSKQRAEFCTKQKKRLSYVKRQSNEYAKL